MAFGIHTSRVKRGISSPTARKKSQNAGYTNGKRKLTPVPLYVEENGTGVLLIQVQQSM